MWALSKKRIDWRSGEGRRKETILGPFDIEAFGVCFLFYVHPCILMTSPKFKLTTYRFFKACTFMRYYSTFNNTFIYKKLSVRKGRVMRRLTDGQESSYVG